MQIEYAKKWRLKKKKREIVNKHFSLLHIVIKDEDIVVDIKRSRFTNRTIRREGKVKKPNVY